MNLGRVTACVWTAGFMLSGCAQSHVQPATEVLVVVNSDLEIGTQLTSLHVLVKNKAGDHSSASDDLALVPQASKEAKATGPYKLPLSFSIVPPKNSDNSRFRIVVTGLFGDQDVVEQQVIVTFQPGKTTLLPVFLSVNCFERLCKDEQSAGKDVVCAAVSQKCDSVPVATGLQIVDPKTSAAKLVQPATTRTDAGSHPVDSVVTGTCSQAADLSICERPNADGSCLDGKCTIVRCREGFFDCDKDAETGCEASLDSVEHCGACGASCSLKHVTRARCEPNATGGPCLIDHGCASDAAASCVQGAPDTGCEPGFSDCDNIASNGCETSLRTLSNCGSCGKTCAIEGVTATCAGGKCAFVGCETGFDDCGSGCASLASDPGHCGACNNACGTTSPMCSGGRCTSAECGAGRGDCDGSAANGCETDLSSAATCGSCSVSCGPYMHALAGCENGKCVVTSCDAGFADCDTTRDNGCETDVTQLASCGSCGNDCSMLPHVAAAACANGGCANLMCSPGWGNCDGDDKNGCEQPLSTLDHCGTCTGTCAPANATGSCGTGHCAISACAEGFDDCNGKVEDGCEAALGDTSTCGMCGNSCPSGTPCGNGGCSCTSACANGLVCCGGACVDTGSTCVPWPCLPGTVRDKNNCGGCGQACSIGACCAGGI